MSSEPLGAARDDKRTLSATAEHAETPSNVASTPNTMPAGWDELESDVGSAVERLVSPAERKIAKQIGKDILRTFGSPSSSQSATELHPNTAEGTVEADRGVNTPAGRAALERLLGAYAVRDRERFGGAVGYCQVRCAKIPR
eukprot:SAG31_NODE_146_length_22601_cov_56.529192_10_plen_142_part_00